MKVLAVFRRYQTAIWLLIALLATLGVASALALPSSIYPEIEFPRIVVVAKSGDAPPDVFVAAATRPLETSLSSVIGLQRIRSKTIRGATEISLDFSEGTNMWQALQLVEAAVSDARSSLPPDAEITVEKVSTGSFPVVTFNLSGSVDPRVLQETATLIVQPALASIPGVGRVETVGGDEREMDIVLDPDAVSALGLSADGVATRLQGTFGQAAVGRVEEGTRNTTVLADAEPRSPEDIGAIPLVTTETGGIIPLSSVADVVVGNKDRRARVGGPHGETVAISVARLPEASTPDVVARALSVAASLKPSLPKGATLEPVYDQALLVNESLKNVRDAILLGIALCLVVVSLFLRDPRAGLVISTSIPITLAITFLFMRVFHQTLNLMSLGGMAVAIGLVIDDAIVVVEAIAHRQSLGDSPREAAMRGTAELAPAVLGTTLTTVVVFVPLAFLEGVVGSFFRALAFTVVTAVLVSMVVALVLIPLASGLALSSKPKPERPDKGRIDAMFSAIVKRPVVAGVAIALVSASGVVLAPRLPSGFLPQMDEGGFVLDYFLPAGSSLNATDAVARKIEKALTEVPEIAVYARRSGAELGPAAATEVSRGDIMVRLKDRSLRKRSSVEVIDALRKQLDEDVPEARIEFNQVLKDVLDDLAGNPRPIEIKLFSQDPDKLAEAADLVADRVKSVDGIVDFFDGREREAKLLRFRVRRDAIARLDARPSDVETELSTALEGRIVGQIRRGDRFVDVRVRYPDPIRFDPVRVRDLPFVAGGQLTSFATVADLEEATEPSVRNHEALQPVISVTGDHETRDLGSIGKDIDAKLAGLKLPEGVRLVMGGQIEAERKTLTDLLHVGGAAVLLVLAVLAAQFRRFRLALLVLVSVPVALVGAMVALFVTKSQLNASSLMGFVLLVGLVVKNGVLLLEEAERLIEEGQAPLSAVANAAHRRLRPILMTTTATIAGLFPLALGIGAGAELQQPLAIAVLGGLCTSTIASLVFLPALAAAALGRAKPSEA